MSMQPFLNCPRFSSCDVNSCPLHPTYPDLHTDPEDLDRKCTLAKTYRIKISNDFPGVLKYGGLTAKEYVSSQRWNNLTPEEREQRRENLKRYQFEPVSQKQNSNPIQTHALNITEGIE